MFVKFLMTILSGLMVGCQLQQTAASPSSPNPTPTHPTHPTRPTHPTHNTVVSPTVQNQTQKNPNPSKAEIRSVEGLLRYYPSDVKSPEAWLGHPFMIGETPILPSETLSEAMLQRQVGKMVRISGPWDAGHLWQPSPQEQHQSRPSPMQPGVTRRGDGIRATVLEVLQTPQSRLSSGAAPGSEVLSGAERLTATRTAQKTAIAALDAKLPQHPSPELAYWQRGMLHAALAQRTVTSADDPQWIQEDGAHLQQAIADFDQAIQVQPQNASAYYHRGQTYALLALRRRMPLYQDRLHLPKEPEDYAQAAIADFTQAIAINATYAEAYTQRGLVHLNELGQVQAAAADLDQALRINPTYGEGYRVRGEAIFARNGDLHPGEREADLQQALADLNQAIRLEPASAQAYLDRANLRANRSQPGDREQARLDYQKSLELLRQQSHPDLLYLETAIETMLTALSG